MKRLMPLPFTVPLEEAAEVRSQLSTPVETMMASDLRTRVIQGLPYVRWQMVFLLLEYGFTDQEIALNMRLRLKSIRNIKYFIRNRLHAEW